MADSATVRKSSTFLIAQLENDTPIEEGVLQPDVDNESGEPGAEMSEAELKESQETAEKLQDFGQKIGMARKDVAERGFARTGKDSELPGWTKKYKVFLLQFCIAGSRVVCERAISTTLSFYI